MRLTAIRGPLGLALLCVTFAGSAHADTTATPLTEVRDRIKVAQTVQPPGDTPFGENINMAKGGLSFQQTDISYAGIGPTITLSRSFNIGGSHARVYTHSDPFGDWAASIPRVETIIPGDIYGTIGEWKQGANGNFNYSRCTNFGVPSVDPYNWLGMHWWSGTTMVTQDGASQPMLRRDAATNTIAPGVASDKLSTYHVVTASNWMISCIPISNATGVNGIQGEGFKALSPDGTTYTFDVLVYGAALETLVDESHGTPFHKIPRKMAYLYVSKIEDRFHNYITYTYDASGHLTAINGSDGRKVAIVNTGRISSITIEPGTPAAQTWSYTYTGGTLTGVEQPDHSTWSFSMGGSDAMDTSSDSTACRSIDFTPNSGPATITMTHPSGLVGTFHVDYVNFSRSKVPNSCTNQTMDGDPGHDTNPPEYVAVSLVSKTFSGPGVAPQTWTYSYGGVPSTDPNCDLTGCTAANTLDVTAPDGTTTRYTHSAEWGPYEGKLLSVVSGISSAAPNGLQTVTYEYATPTQGAYPTHVGDNLDMYLTNNDPLELLTPQTKVTTSLQGVSFVKTVNSFDVYSSPLSVTHASTGNAGGNFSRTDTITYSHDTSLKWVLGQVATTTDTGTTAQTSRTDYDANDLPWKRYGFGGLLQQTLTYNADGTLATVKDGNNNITTLSQWYRGIPRLITFPTTATQSATVDEAGKILSSTDEMGFATSYGYDAMGRLAGITYPTADSVAWNPLSRGFVSVATAEYGLPAGHWKQTVQTGNGKTTTFYDARFLPVLTLTEDIGNAASKSFVVKRFDGVGREVFKSYPVASLGTVNDSLTGISTTYDGLGRPLSVAQDSEWGVLTTTTQYLTGFQTRVTNPRGYSTTTRYQVFDTPSTEAPVRIDAPQGVSTVIARDNFGAPLSITRSGPGN